MGEHRRQGASMGPDYREKLKTGGSPGVQFHDERAPGHKFSTHDGQAYVVAQDGSFRRIADLPMPPDNEMAKADIGEVPHEAD